MEPQQGQQHRNPKDYSREYRDRRKENPEVYRKYRKLETARKINYMARRSEIVIQHNKELQLIRQQKYRNRVKKRKAFIESLSTRKLTEQVRRINREKKRRQRASMHPLKKLSINKKGRELYKANKENGSRTPVTQSSGTPSTSDPVSSEGSSLSSGAMRTAKSRFRKKFLNSLPVELTARAEVILAGLKALTPHTKQTVNTRLGISSPSCKQKLDFDSSVATAVKEDMTQAKMKRSVKAMKLRRLYASAILAKNKALANHMGISRKLKMKVKSASSQESWEDHRVKRKDAIPEETAKAVKDFF